MMVPVDKKTLGRQGREDLRKKLAAPSWSLWTALARSDFMADAADRDRMMERHKIVIALIEVNSQQLRCDSPSAGLDIERLNAKRDAEQLGNTPDVREALTAIEKRTSEIDERKRKLRQERDWLEQSLADFDALMPAKTNQPKGHA